MLRPTQYDLTRIKPSLEAILESTLLMGKEYNSVNLMPPTT